MGRQILVAQLKPGFTAQLFQCRQPLPGFTGQPPAPFGIIKAGQGVHHRIEIGGNTQPQVLKVIGSVGDDS